MKSIYHKISEIEDSIQQAVLCTVIETKGSTPRKIGAKMLIYANASIYGSIGGGALEKKVIEQALEVLKSQQAKRVTHNLVNELGMCCGGTVEIFIEPIMNRFKLYIFGSGHIGKALAKFALDLNFMVTIIDERHDALEGLNLEDLKIISDQHLTAIENLSFDENTCIAIITHDHAYDREILALTSKRKHAYIGMVGSQRKVEIAKKTLEANQLMSNAELDQIDMPIGLDINAITPEEIAISILARLIEVRNKKG